MVFKVPRLLPLLILFHSLCLTSLALRRGPETEVLRCLDDCDDEDVQEYITCHKECELRYREREERREEEGRPGSRELDPRWQRGRGRRRGGGGGGGEREPAWGPGGEYDQCRRLCEPYKPRERERCWEQCEERERARERRRDRERERRSTMESGIPQGMPLGRRGTSGASAPVRGRPEASRGSLREREERETPGGGDAKLLLATTTEDPQQQFQHCQQRCERQQGREPQRRQCRQECERQFQEQQRGKRRSTNPREQEEEEEEVGESGDNPYYFHSRMLHSRFRAEEGQIRVLERFDKRSRLLRGLKNYRLEIFEANPNTFVLPHHVDADCILIVLKGEGTISLVWQDKKQSYHLEGGDVMRVPAGTTVYFISSGRDGQVQIAKLIQPVNIPGTFKEFYPVGTENPESYYKVFSSEILESSLKTSRDQIERLFGQQRQGVMIRASEEQRQALSEHSGLNNGAAL
ncbi:vicilin Car i 2.0101-like [Eucalyptus grandis]|uniref:vicilin Car i 2.0101-like n=1 Tax=Eucalyptus grandis TaxID=71139 RepID=UPI00192EFB1C|nr:vicilin Car i 2.0101-like [Eucalyptus grandis]